MTISMYQASVPVFVSMLGALAGVLDKAKAHAAARKIDPAVLLAARLYPDMHPLVRQVQTTCDFAKGAGARLAGQEVPSYPDTETTFDELAARIAKTLAFLGTLKPEEIDGSEKRDITLRVGGEERAYKGLAYLLNSAMPNFYFHLTIAYAILRENGVEVGKADFLGRTPRS